VKPDGNDLLLSLLMLYITAEYRDHALHT